MAPRHRVGPRSLGPDGIGASGLDDAEEAVEEERRGDGHVGQEAQRWEHPKILSESQRFPCEKSMVYIYIYIIMYVYIYIVQGILSIFDIYTIYIYTIYTHIELG